jgi:hypothetical protein
MTAEVVLYLLSRYGAEGEIECTGQHPPSAHEELAVHEPTDPARAQLVFPGKVLYVLPQKVPFTRVCVHQLREHSIPALPRSWMRRNPAMEGLQASCGQSPAITLPQACDRGKLLHGFGPYGFSLAIDPAVHHAIISGSVPLGDNNCDIDEPPLFSPTTVTRESCPV